MGGLTAAAGRVRRRTSGAGLSNRAILTVVLLAAFLWAALSARAPGGIFHTGGWQALGDIAAAFFAPELDAGFLSKIVADSWRTIAFAVTGMTVAVVIGVPLGVIASGVLSTSAAQKLTQIAAARAFLAVLRSVHEIIWALLFVAAFGLSPIAGVLAIGIPYGGILGRILAERLQDVPEEPLNALRSAGASETKVLLYGRLPMVSADVVSYTFYRLECAVRAAAVLSFVGLGGLGFRISIALDDLRFDQMWTAVFALVVIIGGIYLWSAQVRRRLVR